MNFPVQEKCDYIVKIAIFGAKKVGKTNILSRLCYDDFTGVYKETLGIDFYVKTFTLAQKKIKLQFWDVQVTPKSESQKIRQLCCQGIIGIIIVYSIIDSSSLEYAKNLLTEGIRKQYLSNDIVKILIANKMDLNSQSKVSKDIGQTLAKENGMIFMETSAKDCSGIKQLSYKIGTQLLNIIKSYQLK